jgi:hypothetical protein
MWHFCGFGVSPWRDRHARVVREGKGIIIDRTLTPHTPTTNIALPSCEMTGTGRTSRKTMPAAGDNRPTADAALDCANVTNKGSMVLLQQRRRQKGFLLCGVSAVLFGCWLASIWNHLSCVPWLERSTVHNNTNNFFMSLFTKMGSYLLQIVPPVLIGAMVHFVCLRIYLRRE